MGLKSIEIQGFKSFKEKITLDFNHSITAIVGPNGSGKSNISDAILWVLGEQSAKTLRGNKMQDVIFAGTEKIKPVNVCQVAMTFEKDQYLNIPYEEATVMRRVYRTGESEYYINRTQVRLKDIREFFMDTGIGKEGYSVIGQGKIDQILSAKTDEIRHIFEEASGISKSKYKKEEAIKKLKKTNENLARIEDVLTPQRDRLQFLKREKEKAVRGIELTEIIKDNELRFANEEITRIREKKKVHDEKLRIIYQELKNDELEKKRLLEEKTPAEENVRTLNGKLSSYSEREVQLKGDLDRIQYELNLLEEKNKFSIKDQQRVKKELEEVFLKCSSIEALLLESHEKYKKDVSYQASLKNEIHEQHQKLNEKKTEFYNIQKNNERIAVDLKDVQEQLKKLTVQKETKASLREIQSEKIKILIKEISEMNEKIQGFHRDISNIKADISALQKERRKNEDKLIKSNAQLQKIHEKEQIYKQTQIKQNDEIREKEHRLSILENSIKSREGFYYSVQNFFKLRRNTNIEAIDANPFAELIQAKKGYEKVIEILLQPVLQNIVVPTKVDAKDCIEFLKKRKIGRLTFLPIDNIHARKDIQIKDPLALGLASDFVETSSNIQNIIDYFLNQTIVVSTMEDALILSKKYPRNRIVTMDGDLINTSGSMVGGYKKDARGDSVFNRNQQFIDLRDKYQELLKKQKDIQHLIQKLISDKEHIEHEKNQLDEKIKKFKQSEKERSDQQFAKQQELKYLQIERDKKHEEQEKIESEQSSENNDLREIERLEEREKKLKSEMQQDESSLHDVRIKMEFSLNNVQNNYDLVQRDVLLLSNKIKDLEDEKSDYMKKRDQLREEINRHVEDFSINEELKKKYKQEKEQMTFALNNLQNELPNIKKELSSKSEHCKMIFEKSSEIMKRVEMNTFRLESMEQEKIRYIEEVEKIENLMKDTYGLSPTQYQYQNIQKINKKELLLFKDELRNLGPFSVDMIDEYQFIKDEVEFLEKQKQDLCTAREDMDMLIKELDRDMKCSFKISFDEINERFNQIFQTLFQGGKAELILQGTDYLSSNIEIVAKPPGKKLQSLSLLSGGERSLTAICLLFAIFETKPSSFCLLDEIDAALDELNIHRFKKYLIKFAEQTQFLIITHRKSTMEMADVLYGVSMEEQGISKVIELNLGEKYA